MRSSLRNSIACISLLSTLLPVPIGTSATTYRATNTQVLCYSPDEFGLSAANRQKLAQMLDWAVLVDMEFVILRSVIVTGSPPGQVLAERRVLLVQQHLERKGISTPLIRSELRTIPRQEIVPGWACAYGSGAVEVEMIGLGRKMTTE